MNSKQTSRSSIVDEIELVANLIASVSHLQELLAWYIIEKDAENAERTSDRIAGLVDMRRNLMTMMKQRFATDSQDYQYWCLTKHAIAQRQYATEVMYANRDRVEYMQMTMDLQSYMFEIISQWLGYEVVQCGRCLADEINKDGK